MFKNSDNDNDNDTEARHTCSGREFREVHLVNLFKKNYGDEGFYSGEEEDLTDEKNSEPARVEEGKFEEPHREEPKTLGTVHTAEVSTIIPLVDSVALSNQSNPSHQSVQSTFTGSPPNTQSGTLGRYMGAETGLSIFRGDGSEDPNEQWFLCEVL
jgi:hypothetical protein